MQMDHICNKHVEKYLSKYIKRYMFRRKYKDIHIYMEKKRKFTYIPLLALEENHRARACRLQGHEMKMKSHSKGTTQ
jgi:hypothetical protein